MAKLRDVLAQRREAERQRELRKQVEQDDYWESIRDVPWHWLSCEDQDDILAWEEYKADKGYW